MKILLAINSDKWKKLPDRALRWCGRSGFEIRIFVAKIKYRQAYDWIAPEANYQYYMALDKDIVVSRTTPEEYAKQHGYDLLLTIPEELMAWRKGTEFRDNEIVYLRRAIGAARVEFGKKPKMRIKRFANGSVMRRVSML